MVVSRTSFNEYVEQKHFAVKKPLSATHIMLDILESPKPLTSHEHSPEIRFDRRPIAALAE
jgi:hypothetical protein